MDAYDFEQIDKAMSKRVDAIYSDPARHVFCSQHQFNLDNDMRGRRGALKKGRKTVCAYCGQKKIGHAEVTEQL